MTAYRVEIGSVAEPYSEVVNTERGALAAVEAAIWHYFKSGRRPSESTSVVVRPLNERVEEVTGPAEFAVIGHLRGWCHNLSECAICQAERRAAEARRDLESVISG